MAVHVGTYVLGPFASGRISNQRALNVSPREVYDPRLRPLCARVRTVPPTFIEKGKGCLRLIFQTVEGAGHVIKSEQ